MRRQMKRRKGSETSRLGDAIGTDRISDFPEHIIHNILSFLPTEDAVRTTALSKRFRFAWTSFPSIDFDCSYDEKFYDGGRERFLNFMHDSLRRRARNICVEKFRLKVDLGNMESEYRTNGAISYATEHQVKELDLDFRNQIYGSQLLYKLPSILFPINSIKVLKLKGFNLETLDLKKFPSTEELRLMKCNGLEILKVSDAKLEIMEVESCGGLLQIDISKSNLRSFSFKGKYSRRRHEQCQINLENCESLINLALEGAGITCVSFNNNVSKLLLLENLILSDCRNLQKLYISNPKLREVRVNSCFRLEKIELFALNLESFVYNGPSKQYEITITACKFLRNLELHYVNITDRWVEKNVSELPYLENLQLCYCNMLRRLCISHEELKSFVLTKRSRLEKAVICARNLISFRYDGEVIHSPLSVDSPQLEAELTLNTASQKNTEGWYKELRNFLGYFDHCKLLTLHCIEEFLIFPDDLREILLPPLHDLRHLKVKVHSPPKDIMGLVDSLLWLSPLLETMSIVVSSAGAEKSLKFQFAEPLAAEDKVQLCCHSRIIKCWRHYLKEVSMRNFDNDDMEKLVNYFGRKAKRLETIVTT